MKILKIKIQNFPKYLNKKNLNKNLNYQIKNQIDQNNNNQIIYRLKIIRIIVNKLNRHFLLKKNKYKSYKINIHQFKQIYKIKKTKKNYNKKLYKCLMIR